MVSQEQASEVQTRKKVLRMIPYGVFVVTSRFEDVVAGATIDWVTQASIEPLTLVSCLRKDSVIFDVLRKSRRYAIHILGADQKDFAAQFFRFKFSSDHEINGQACTLSAAGVPILRDAPASLEMEMVDAMTHADHAVVLGNVRETRLNRETPALLLRDTGWHYGA